MTEYPQINQVNENTLIIYFNGTIEIGTPSQISSLVKAIKKWPDAEIIDVTPSYTSLLINYNPLISNYEQIHAKLIQSLVDCKTDKTANQSQLIEIPVYYSTESGLDLEDTANLIGVSIETLIELHSQPEYTVFALGFMPGFAFMGIIEPQLVLPRLSTPRTTVPPGSVAIAEKQTAIYPDSTPGGWRLLGRSPMTLFDSKLNPPQPYQIGDRVKFTPITRESYLALGGEL